MTDVAKPVTEDAAFLNEFETRRITSISERALAQQEAQDAAGVPPRRDHLKDVIDVCNKFDVV